MKYILLFLLLFFPSRHVEQIDVKLITEQNSIFPDFENENFSQNVEINGKEVNILIENSNYLDMNLNHRLFQNLTKLKTVGKYVNDTFNELFNENMTLRTYMMNISFYLKDNIKYWGDSPFKEPEEVVVYKKTNCIGYSALVKELLELVNIKSRFISGFYLKNKKKGSYDPVPHRWLELLLPDATSFFYDPQYQGFKANYIIVRPDSDFKTIRKFKINILKKGKKLEN